jgi:hypothetical protein
MVKQNVGSQRSFIYSRLHTSPGKLGEVHVIITLVIQGCRTLSDAYQRMKPCICCKAVRRLFEAEKMSSEAMIQHWQTVDDVTGIGVFAN